MLPISLAQSLSLLSRPKISAFLNSIWLPSSLQTKQGIAPGFQDFAHCDNCCDEGYSCYIYVDLSPLRNRQVFTIPEESSISCLSHVPFDFLYIHRSPAIFMPCHFARSHQFNHMMQCTITTSTATSNITTKTLISKDSEEAHEVYEASIVVKSFW